MRRFILPLIVILAIILASRLFLSNRVLPPTESILPYGYTLLGIVDMDHNHVANIAAIMEGKDSLLIAPYHLNLGAIDENGDNFIDPFDHKFWQLRLLTYSPQRKAFIVKPLFLGGIRAIHYVPNTDVAFRALMADGTKRLLQEFP